MTNYYLEPKFDSHKSFYNKAQVVESGGKSYLYSYGRLVCEIVNGKYYLYDSNSTWDIDPFTMTTRRHIKDFLYQAGVEVSRMWNDVYDNAAGVKLYGKWIVKESEKEVQAA